MVWGEIIICLESRARKRSLASTNLPYLISEFTKCKHPAWSLVNDREDLSGQRLDLSGYRLRLLLEVLDLFLVFIVLALNLVA